MSYVLVVFGRIIFVCRAPVTSTPSPTMIFLVTAIPPCVMMLPLFKLVLAAGLVVVKDPVILALPCTSNASSGLL